MSLLSAQSAGVACSSAKLCLLVSRRCNLRCGFCRVDFTGLDMDWPTAEAGIEHYLAFLNGVAAPRIKFFGGEPLLNARLIRKIVEAGRDRWRNSGLRFEISTNGTLLDDELASYFAARPEVEITVSQWQPRAAKLPGAWYTLVMEPGQPPKEFATFLGRLWQAGFRGFNFLPVYYKPWTPEQLGFLRLSLAAARKFILGLRERGRLVRVKNLQLWSPMPLYNDALTVDVDGTFYASNLVQCEGAKIFHGKLLLGSVAEPLGFLRQVRRPSGDELLGLVRSWAGPKSWDSTMRADAILTEFVESLATAFGRN